MCVYRYVNKPVILQVCSFIVGGVHISRDPIGWVGGSASIRVKRDPSCITLMVNGGWVDQNLGFFGS